MKPQENLLSLTDHWRKLQYAINQQPKNKKQEPQAQPH